jgi:2,3-bisphosphoglycerate-dependent phosphoglycerate mutase
VPPPAADPSHEYHPSKFAWAQSIDPSLLPNTESLKLTLERVLPYWNGEIVPQIKAGKRVLVAAHGNSIRAILK